MSSDEMAELTETRHDSVKRTIDALRSRGVIQLPQIVDVKRTIDALRSRGVIQLPQIEDVKNHLGQTATTYNLPRYETDLLITGYSITYRAAVIKRWHELESVTNNIMSTLGEVFH